jgi:hypothetical protein
MLVTYNYWPHENIFREYDFNILMISVLLLLLMWTAVMHPLIKHSALTYQFSVIFKLLLVIDRMDHRWAVCGDGRLMTVGGDHIHWQALVSVLLNLWVLLPVLIIRCFFLSGLTYSRHHWHLLVTRLPIKIALKFSTTEVKQIPAICFKYKVDWGIICSGSDLHTSNC